MKHTMHMNICKYGLRTLVLAGALATLLSSCTFEDQEITIGKAVVYFVNQQYNRNLVVGEGLKMNVGVNLAGMAENKVDRAVTLEVDPSLVPEGESLLPEGYYSFPQGLTVSIPTGALEGYCPVQLDSTAFLADPEALTGKYVLPLRIAKLTQVDTITLGKEFICLNISYYAKQHGNYYYQGVTTRNGATELSYRNDPATTASVRTLTTVGPTRFVVGADESALSADPGKKAFTYVIDVPTLGGGEVTLSADPKSAIAVSANGSSSYDEKTKTFVLNYRYTLKDGTACTACDTLSFRNRIRDVQTNGLYLNEWRGF